MSPSLKRTVVAATVLVTLAGCRETAPAAAARPVDPVAGAMARVEFSRVATLEPGQVALALRVLGTGTDTPIASFTATVTYDAARLRYVGELGGTGTVVTNGAMPGTLRVAGFHADGFPDGTLATVVLEARGEDPGTPALAFTELHTVDGRDLRTIAIAEPAGWRAGAR